MAGVEPSVTRVGSVDHVELGRDVRSFAVGDDADATGDHAATPAGMTTLPGSVVTAPSSMCCSRLEVLPITWAKSAQTV